MARDFIPGLQLNRLFFQEAVEPILCGAWPGLRYSAGLLGHGSDALGFDTAQSMDHDWGPRVQLFLDDAEVETLRGPINAALRHHLPRTFRGFTTHFEQVPGGVRWLAPAGDGDALNHGVRILGVRGFFQLLLNWSPPTEIQLVDWLTFPEQDLRSLTHPDGIFQDGLEVLRPVQAQLRHYPRDVWLYLLASQWERIGQEAPFMGRCGQAGDEIGSRLVAARLVRDVMRLCFLMARQYAPYIKWFGTAFARLACARDLSPLFDEVFAATTWQTRERPLSRVYEFIAAQHNALRLTPALPTQVGRFHDRPFQVIEAEQFAAALREAIRDNAVRALPRFGAVDQFVDSTDVLSNPVMVDRAKCMYRP